MAKRTNYTWEEREEIIKRTLPPENTKVSALAKEIGVSETTLYAWRKKINNKRFGQTTKNKRTIKWSSEDKFHIVMETYSLNEADLAAYCRKKGLYTEQVKSWIDQCLHANNAVNRKDVEKRDNELKEEKKHSADLESELLRKEKALAETAALLVLKKKAQQIWGAPEED